MLDGKNIDDPQNGRKWEVVSKHYMYQNLVADIQAKKLLSLYVYLKDVASPPTPPLHVNHS